MFAKVSIISKALSLGPLPYLALAAIILIGGAVLQMQSSTTQNFAGGRSIFGLSAQIGGAVGLFGLLALAFGGKGAAKRPRATPTDTPTDDVPASAREARMETAAPRPTRPDRSGPGRGKSAAARLPQLKDGSAASLGKSAARQAGMRMIGQMMRRSA